MATGQRRRGAELERAILLATAEELAASGYHGMTRDKVTVLDADGSLLLAEEDDSSAAPTKMAGLQKLVGQTKKPFRFFTGYAGWAGGQLEDELKAGGWLTVKAKVLAPLVRERRVCARGAA